MYAFWKDLWEVTICLTTFHWSSSGKSMAEVNMLLLLLLMESREVGGKHGHSLHVSRYGGGGGGCGRGAARVILVSRDFSTDMWPEFYLCHPLVEDKQVRSALTYRKALLILANKQKQTHIPNSFWLLWMSRGWTADKIHANSPG